jgi:hypothetical protein
MADLASLEKALSSLQYEMARVDLFARKSSHPDFIEFLILKLESIAFRMDGSRNHSRPHIHVDYGKDWHAASYAIDNGERLAGELNRKYDKVVRNWIEANRVDLLKAWESVQARETADQIVCQIRAK